MNSETDRARLFAYKLMSYRPRSESELQRRLEQKGFSTEIINVVIKHLVRLGYIDDKAFACFWVASRKGSKGCYGLRRELLDKGIDLDVINGSLAEYRPEDEYNLALKMARKKNALCGPCPYPRLAGFLKRRGFSYDVINRVCLDLGCGEV